MGEFQGLLNPVFSKVLDGWILN